MFFCQPDQEAGSVWRQGTPPNDRGMRPPQFSPQTEVMLAGTIAKTPEFGVADAMTVWY